jgi:hypothetical protein
MPIKRVAMLLALCFLFVGKVYADTVTVGWNDIWRYKTNDYSLNPHGDDPNKFISTTEFDLVLDGISTYGYCIDPEEPMVNQNPNDYNYTISSWNEGYHKAAWLMEEYAPTNNTQNETIALQAAIWTVVTNNSGYAPANEDTDYFKFYHAYMTELDNNFNSSNVVSLEQKYRLLNLEGGQPLIAPVPIPGAVLLFGSGIIGLIGIKRKMQHR